MNKSAIAVIVSLLRCPPLPGQPARRRVRPWWSGPARLRQRGEPRATSYRVFALPSIREALEAAPPEADPEDGPLESALVVPTGTQVGLVEAIFEDRQLYVNPQILGGPIDSGDWQFAGGHGCIRRHQNGTARYSPCQWFSWLPDDGDPDHQYWAAQYYGTGKSKGAFTLDALQAAGWRSPGTERQEWVDWNPRSDRELPNCERQTVGVNIAGFEVSRQDDHCELWDIDKGDEPAEFANWWRGVARRSERDASAIGRTHGSGPATRTTERTPTGARRPGAHRARALGRAQSS